MPKILLQNKVLMFQIRFLLMIVFTVNLTACNNNGFKDLQQYMAGVQLRPKIPIKPFPEFKTLEPFIFKSDVNFRDPFKPVEKAIVVEENKENDIPNNRIYPDVSRVKEALEAFSLNNLQMVGTVDMNQVLWGLIKAEDNAIYRVKKGDYLGGNDGKITKIDKNKIELVEIIPTTPKRKRFTEQSATLTLTE